MNFSFNPCEMDYSSWLTVAGFSMTLLALFMNEIFNKIITENREENIVNFYPILGSVVGLLTISIIASILCFIFNKENIGAILATIVLFGLTILTPLLFIVNLMRAREKEKNNSNKNKIEQILLEFQPNTGFDSESIDNK